MSPPFQTSLPSASPSHSSACHRAPVWVPWVTQQTSIGYLFYIRYYKFPCYCLHTSHLLPPTLPPRPQVCSLCLFLHCCPENKFISATFLDTIICISIWYLYFSFWLTSLCIIGSRFVHLIRTDSNAFLFYSWVIFHVYLYHNFFTHSSVKEHPSWFHVLAIVNSAAMNIGAHVSFSVMVSSRYMPSSGIVGSYGSFIRSF